VQTACVATNPNVGPTFNGTTYTLSGADAAQFAVDASTGAILCLAQSPATYTPVLTATTSGGASSQVTLTLTVTFTVTTGARAY
jgi:hypothetical protein